MVPHRECNKEFRVACIEQALNMGSSQLFISHEILRMRIYCISGRDNLLVCGQYHIEGGCTVYNTISYST
jgi:hypothetical protein